MARIVPARRVSPPPSFVVARTHCEHKAVSIFHLEKKRKICSNNCLFVDELCVTWHLARQQVEILDCARVLPDA